MKNLFSADKTDVADSVAEVTVDAAAALAEEEFDESYRLVSD